MVNVKLYKLLFCLVFCNVVFLKLGDLEICLMLWVYFLCVFMSNILKVLFWLMGIIDLKIIFFKIGLLIFSFLIVLNKVLKFNCFVEKSIVVLLVIFIGLL